VSWHRTRGGIGVRKRYLLTRLAEYGVKTKEGNRLVVLSMLQNMEINGKKWGNSTCTKLLINFKN